MITKIILCMSLLGINITLAETLTCKGKSDTNHDVELSINMAKKKSSIRFFAGETPTEGSVLQGLDLHEKSIYKNPKLLRYEGRNSNDSFLELTLDEDGKILKSIFNKPLSGFINSPFSCEVVGSFPEAPHCDAFASELLISAIKNNESIDEIKWQLYCGANVNYKDMNGCTALLYAFDLGCGLKKSSAQGPGGGVFAQTNIFTDLLIQNGAFVDLVDPINNQTPLIKAARFGVSDVYENFIAGEANFDAQDTLGNTALMYAVLWGDPFIVKNILRGNPDRRLKNKEGKSAYDLAVQWQKEKVINLVKIADSTMTIKGNEDGTCSPLKIEFKKGQVVDLVLSATDKMFKLESEDLNLDMMADRNSTAGQTIFFEEEGKYKFTCGVHGNSNVSLGEIEVKN